MGQNDADQHLRGIEDRGQGHREHQELDGDHRDRSRTGASEETWVPGKSKLDQISPESLLESPRKKQIAAIHLQGLHEGHGRDQVEVDKKTSLNSIRIFAPKFWSQSSRVSQAKIEKIAKFVKFRLSNSNSSSRKCSSAIHIFPPKLVSKFSANHSASRGHSTNQRRADSKSQLSSTGASFSTNQSASSEVEPAESKQKALQTTGKRPQSLSRKQGSNNVTSSPTCPPTTTTRRPPRPPTPPSCTTRPPSTPGRPPRPPWTPISSSSWNRTSLWLPQSTRPPRPPSPPRSPPRPPRPPPRPRGHHAHHGHRRDRGEHGDRAVW